MVSTMLLSLMLNNSGAVVSDEDTDLYAREWSAFMEVCERTEIDKKAVI